MTLSEKFIKQFFKGKIDNALHFSFSIVGAEILSALISLIQFFEKDYNLLLTASICLILIFAKEFYDKISGGKFSKTEILFGVIGIMLWVSVNLISRFDLCI